MHIQLFLWEYLTNELSKANNWEKVERKGYEKQFVRRELGNERGKRKKVVNKRRIYHWLVDANGNVFSHYISRSADKTTPRKLVLLQKSFPMTEFRRICWDTAAKKANISRVRVNYSSSFCDFLSRRWKTKSKQIWFLSFSISYVTIHSKLSFSFEWKNLFTRNRVFVP